MSFLVVFNGQFTPFHPGSGNESARVRPVDRVTSAHDVPEFKDVLKNFDEETRTQLHSGVEVYQQHTKKFEESKKREHARDIMTSPVRVISQSAPATEALKMTEKFGFRHLPVVNEKDVIVGMISDRELLGPLEVKTCQDIMVKNLIVSDELTSINEIAMTLLKEKMNALPIVNRKNEVSGIITLTDILSYVIRSTPFLGSA